MGGVVCFAIPQGGRCMSIAIMNLQRITPFAISAFLLTLVPETSAATWFVAPDGTGDGSAGNPWGDIKTAVASNSPVKAGDTIVVRAGTYSLSSAVDFRKSGSAGNPIRCTAEAGVVLNVTSND